MRGLLHRIQVLESDLGAVRAEASDSGRNKRKRKREAASGTLHIDTQSPPSPSLSPPGTDAPRITHKERTRHYPVKGRDSDETESDPGMRGAMERSVSGTSSTQSPPARTRTHPPYSSSSLPHVCAQSTSTVSTASTTCPGSQLTHSPAISHTVSHITLPVVSPVKPARCFRP
jgi:hypothetical protein